MVVIFRTSGCWWSKKKGCLMCGYNLASREGIGADSIIAQLSEALTRYEGEPMVKIYTSGSFLDPNEIPTEARDKIIRSFPQAERILFESRPEFVNEENLRGLPSDRIEIALGLESADDEVLLKCVRKGFRVADSAKAAEIAMAHGMKVRTYLLLKPPYMTERQAIEDTIKSIAFAARRSESISINPLNVQNGTEVERLWKRGNYRPPWLWSLVEVLREGKKLAEARVFSSPSGAGSPRGVHNCGKCDADVINAIKRFSFTQDVREFDGLDCSCKRKWKAQLELQDAMRTSVDIDRHLDSELTLD